MPGLHDMLDEARIPAGGLEARVQALIDREKRAHRLNAHLLDHESERVTAIREGFSRLREPQDIPALTLRIPEAASC